MTKVFIFSILFTFQSFSKGITTEGYFIHDPSKSLLKIWKKNKELVVDHVLKDGHELYGPKGLGEYLDQLGVNYSQLIEFHHDKEIKGSLSYPTPDEISKKLKKIAKKNPDLIKLVNIGESSQGHPLWFVKISDNPQIDEIEPEVKYVANMHGNEIVGRELMILFIEDLIDSYHKGHFNIRQLVDNTEIWIMPSMNPDGASLRRRGNSNYVDLNRDFPDFTTMDNINIPDGRQKETVALMNFQAKRQFVLSANFHGGTKCVNYPWDTTSSTFPLEKLIILLSREYASRVPGMYDSTEFEDGIVNGHDWYEVNGGMQDWSNYWYNDLQVTIELSHEKWPSYSRIQDFYSDNRWSLIRFLQRAHQGAGFKFSNRSVEGSVKITKKNGENDNLVIGTFGFSNGEFYKVLEKGQYQFDIVQKDQNQKSFDLHVSFENGSKGNNYILL